ncbi:hypothetical protein MCOR27_004819 [Pyricularia oryzae]|nr:hypothetical protein MCOR27_004819 [Pyricularia oryzae]
MAWLVMFPVLCPRAKRSLCRLSSKEASLLPVYLPARYMEAQVYRIPICPCVGREVRSSMRAMILGRSMSPRK